MQVDGEGILDSDNNSSVPNTFPNALKNKFEQEWLDEAVGLHNASQIHQSKDARNPGDK